MTLMNNTESKCYTLENLMYRIAYIYQSHHGVIFHP